MPTHTQAAVKKSLVALHAMGQALDALEVAMCVFDDGDRAVLWNAQFLDFFPEHEGHIHLGEHYADNLRRFYRCRLSDAELPELEHYVREGVARHHAQLLPFDFDHRGFRVRASSVQAGPLGRVRVWRKTRALPLAVPRPQHPAPLALSEDAALALECIADGALVADAGGVAVWANGNFRRMYGLSSGDAVGGLDFPSIYRRAWRAHMPTEGFHHACARLLECQRFSGAPYEIALPADRWVRVIERRGIAPDGLSYFSHVDITALIRHQHALAIAQERLQALATTDGLTGLRNRSFFDAMLQSEWRRTLRGEGALALLMIDIDHFKNLNDRHGHLAGDAVLKAVAARIAGHARRAGDLVARFGGEEFAMLLPGTDAAVAVAMAETLRASVAGMALQSDAGEPLAVTISVGLGMADGSASSATPHQLIAHADAALYRAKRHGRDRVACHGEQT
jgi:diguanylate cyclase (GGDEF)-like protein